MLADSEAAQNEENQAKLRLQTKLRQIEDDRAAMEEQLEDADTQRENLQQQVCDNYWLFYNYFILVAGRNVYSL